MNLTAIWVVFLTALTISAIFIPVIIKVSHRKGWYDSQDHRKIHDGDIPRLGGIGIFAGFIIAVVIFYFLLIRSCDSYECPSLFKFLIFIFSAGLVHFTGLFDDFFNLRPRNKLIIQILGAVLAAAAGLRFYKLSLFFTNITVDVPLVSWIITIVWIVGVCNAVNLIDGMDGQSSIISIISAGAFGVLGLLSGAYLTAFLAFALTGALFGFLIYNKPPAKIFMGDSGSLFLGFTLAILPLIELSSIRVHSLSVSITILLIPITDTLFAMTRRIIRKMPISSPDREHLHHTLLDLGFSTVKILFMVGGYCLLLTVVPFLFHQIETSWVELLMLALWVSTFILFYWLHKLVRLRNKK